MTHSFDWKPSTDPRSKLHPVRGLAAVESPRFSRYWRIRQILDQGEEGACVGHGVTGAITASPIRVALPYPQQTAFGVYYEAQRIDETPGENYSGTSVNAGMKAARELGLISAWEWCPDPTVLRNTVLDVGPVVLGCWFIESWEVPPAGGLVVTEGGILGGHCMYITAYCRRRAFPGYDGPVYQVAQSWGVEFGVRGFFYIRESDVVDFMFGRDAEFAIPRK